MLLLHVCLLIKEEAQQRRNPLTATRSIGLIVRWYGESGRRQEPITSEGRQGRQWSLDAPASGSNTKVVTL